MSRNKKQSLRVAPQDAAAHVDALAESLGYAGALARAEQQPLRKRGQHVPAEIVAMLAQLSEQNGGSVGGFAFDAAAARDALAQAQASRAVAKSARRLARRAESDDVRRLALVADRSMAALQALARVVRTPEGKALREAYDQMQALMRATQRRRGRAGRAASSPAQPSKPSTNGVQVAKANDAAKPAPPSGS